jgi:hypothetical protein
VETLAREFQGPFVGHSGRAGVELQTCLGCPPANSPCADPHVCRVVPEEER